MVWAPTTVVATVRRFIRHFAVTFARGLAHVHHRIVIKSLSGTTQARRIAANIAKLPEPLLKT
jgi:hypothetical protein